MKLWVREAFYVDESEPAVYYKSPYCEAKIFTSPLFMPRKYSRLTLEITNVRCERVQEITCDDVIAEGYGRGINYIQAEIAFADAWDALNKKRGYGWDTNPWVWVIEFKKIEGGDNE